jgi:hypothetical protein
MEASTITSNRGSLVSIDKNISEDTNPESGYAIQGREPVYGSNEAGLEVFRKDLESVEGEVAIGVGLDQMFDMINACPAITEAYIVDYLPPVTKTSRAICEVGAHLFEATGSYPVKDDIIAFFTDAKVTELHALLKSIGYSEEDIRDIEDVRQRVVHAPPQNQDERDHKVSLAEYLRLRSEIPNQTNKPFYWMDSAEGIQKIISMYMSGNLHFIIGDLGGEKSIQTIAAKMQSEFKNLGFLYLSNAEMYLDDQATMEKFGQNMKKIPVDLKTKVFRTTGLWSFMKINYSLRRSLVGDIFVDLWHYNSQSYFNWEQNHFIQPEYFLLDEVSQGFTRDE